METRWKSLTLLDDGAAADGKTGELLIAIGQPVACRGADASAARAQAILTSINLDPAAGSTLDIPPAGPGEPRLLLLRVGDGAGALTHDDWLWAGSHLFAAMQRLGLATVHIPASTLLGGASALDAILEGAFGQSFALGFGKAFDAASRPAAVIVAPADRPLAERKLREATAVNRARAWTDQPSNLLTPPAFAREAEEILQAIGANIHVFGPDALKTMGANLLHAVGRGSEHGAHLFVAEWRGDPDRDTWDAVLIGKGLTFDGGGMNLKDRPFISRMKLDKAGGAAVLGALEMAIARGSKANVVAIVPMAENSIDALAYRPGDILISLAGLSVEVADTDFEGRLALADAMTYAVRTYRPTWTIDIATLTTVVMAALYEDYAGLLTTDETLSEALIAAGEASGDRLWRFPLDRAQDYIVASDIADVVNVGAAGGFGLGSGSPAAGAKFLEKFAEGTRWAHIDMASVAIASRPIARRGTGATGYGVRLLDHWLQSIESE